MSRAAGRLYGPVPACYALAMAKPSVGDIAPDFDVRDTDDNQLKLSDMVERGPVILAFFPKAFTPG